MLTTTAFLITLSLRAQKTNQDATFHIEHNPIHPQIIRVSQHILYNISQLKLILGWTDQWPSSFGLGYENLGVGC